MLPDYPRCAGKCCISASVFTPVKPSSAISARSSALTIPLWATLPIWHRAWRAPTRRTAPQSWFRKQPPIAPALALVGGSLTSFRSSAKPSKCGSTSHWRCSPIERSSKRHLRQPMPRDSPAGARRTLRAPSKASTGLPIATPRHACSASELACLCARRRQVTGYPLTSSSRSKHVLLGLANVACHTKSQEAYSGCAPAVGELAPHSLVAPHDLAVAGFQSA